MTVAGTGHIAACTPRTRRPVLAARRSGGGQVAVMRLLVGLFLILFAFFVVLAGQARRDGSRERRALGSLAEQFAPDDGDGTVRSGPGRTISPAVALARRLASLLPPGGDLAGDERTVRLVLPDAALFEPGSLGLRRDRLVMLARIAGAMATGAGSATATLRIATARAFPEGVMAARAPRDAERAGLVALARALIRFGASREAVTIGWEKDAAPGWTFTFATTGIGGADDDGP